MPSNVILLHLKQTFPPIIWIFTEGEDDGIESRLPFKIFSTLHYHKDRIFVGHMFLFRFRNKIAVVKIAVMKFAQLP